MPDIDTQLTALYDEVVKLQNAGKDREAAELLKQKFFELPEEAQGELLSRMYAQAMIQKISDEDMVAEIQAEALDTLDELDTPKDTPASTG